jgi:HPt (histidine-containing phosphotransfer) domain-containing protein
MSNTPKIVNMDLLKKNSKGNHELLLEMIQVFLEETPAYINKMKEGVETGNWELLRSGSHSIIPSLSIMGLHPEYEAMARVIQEFAGKKERMTLLSELVKKLDSACRKAYQELEALTPVLQK